MLDTDYTNYASVYSCDVAGAFVLEYAWLLGREQTMTQEVRVIFIELIKKHNAIIILPLIFLNDAYRM